MRIHGIPAILLLASALISCHFFGPIDEAALPEPISRPADSLLVGAWSVDSFSTALVHEHYGPNAPDLALLLDASGRFTFQHAPDFIHTGAGKPVRGAFETLTGRWSVTNHGQGWGLNMLHDPSALFAEGLNANLDIRQGEHGLTLLLFIGDPDQGDRLLFTRRATSPPPVKVTDQVTPAGGDTVTEVRREYPFADRRMFEVNRYQGGRKHGIQLLYDLNTSKRPKYMALYADGLRLWTLYPSADVDLSLEHGRLVKGVGLGVDSIHIQAPFDSTGLWYEGLFLRVDGFPTPMGTHRIFDEQGNLRYVLEYDLSRGPHPPSKRPIRVTRSSEHTTP